MENQMESNRNMQNDLRKELNIRKRVEELFYIIDPHHDQDVGISKHVFLRSVQLDENVRSALLIWPQLKILGQPKTYMNAFKRLDTNSDNYVSIEELSYFISYSQETLLNKSASSAATKEEGKVENTLTSWKNFFYCFLIFHLVVYFSFYLSFSFYDALPF